MNSRAHNNDLIDAPEFSEQAISGRPTWDDRGNSVWEWQTAPGVYSRDISSQQLQALEAVDLHLEDTMRTRIDAHVVRKHSHADARSRAPNHNELVIPMRRREK